MNGFFVFSSLISLAIIVQSFPGEGFDSAYKYLMPSDFSEGEQQRLFNVPFGGDENYVLRNAEETRQETEESRPLCEEERKSLSIRELISSPTSNFLQTSDNPDFKKFNLVPRKVDVIKCVREPSDTDSKAVCKPENCKERKVDIPVFGRLKNDTDNVWKFLGTLSAVPVACECFIRWKPEKCSRAIDIFTNI